MPKPKKRLGKWKKNSATANPSGPTAAPTPEPTSSFEGGQQLLVIDNEPLRKKAFHEYEVTQKKAESLREKLTRFEQADLEAYRKWEAQAFGPLLTQIRTLQEELRDKANLLHEVDLVMGFENCSEVEAYLRVMRRRKGEEPSVDYQQYAEAEQKQKNRDAEEVIDEFLDACGPNLVKDIARLPELPKKEQERQGSEFEYAAEMFWVFEAVPYPGTIAIINRARARVGLKSWDFPEETEHHENRRQPPPDHRPTHAQKKQGPSAEVKALYRRLVRALHPDTNGSMTERERELWEATKLAYQHNDHQALESVAACVEMGVEGNRKSAAISVLRRVTQELRKSLSQLTSALNRARKHVAWNFNPESKKLIRHRTKREGQLMEEIKEMEFDLDGLNHHLRQLEKRAHASPKAKSAKKPPEYRKQQTEFAFG
ncbi:MAG: hypothetical protein ACFCU3_02850 [Verrucomicrobiales bacterium]